MALISVKASLTPPFQQQPPLAGSVHDTLQTSCMDKCMKESVCCSNLGQNILTGQRTMFNYGSREIIKLVIQALHQRLSERSRFLINHTSDEENLGQIVFSFLFAFVYLRTLAKDSLQNTHFLVTRFNAFRTECNPVFHLALFCVGAWSSC